MTENENAALLVKNATRETVLVSKGRVAKSAWAKFRGLMGSPPLANGEGLLIASSNSIHTHFIRFPIDVLYIDRENRVVAMDENMKPWRIGRIHRTARCVLELPAGVIAATQTQVGDVLESNNDCTH